MTARCPKVLGSLIAGLRRFPLVLVAGLAAFAAALVLNHASGNKDLVNHVTRLMLAALAALPLAVGAGFAGEVRGAWRWAAVAVASALAAGIWLALPLGMENSAHNYRYAAMLLGAVAVASAVPGAGGNGVWWRMNVGLIQAVVLAGILSGIVLSGLLLAVFSVEKLFGFDVDKLYLDLMSFTAFIVAPAAVVTLLPSAAEGRGATAGSAFWEGLCKWVLVPLGFVFIAILAAYAVTILVHLELPDGMVATPVLSLGAYGTAAMLLLQPWPDERAWARWFARVYPPAFLAFSVLLFLAIAERIGAYGVTFARYSALAFGLWFALAAVVFLLRPGKGSLLITGLLAVVAALAALGPVSAATLSLRSQSDRLRQLLRNPDSAEDRREILSGLTYLMRNFGLAAVENVTGPLGLDAEATRSWQLPGEAMKKLGLDVDGGAFKFEWNGAKPIPAESFRFIHLVRSGTTCELGKSAEGKHLAVRLRSSEVAVFAGNEKIRELLPSALEGLKTDTNAEAPLLVPFTADGREFCLVVLRVEMPAEQSNRHSLRRLDYLVLEK